MATKRGTRRRPPKRNGSLAVARLSALDLENIAQAELCHYFEIPPGIADPNGSLPPQSRRHGGQLGLAPAARLNIYPEVRARILFELERLIRRAHLQAARAAVLDARSRYEHQQRALGDWEISREAMDRLKGRLTDFDRKNPFPTRARRPVGLVRDGWRLWKTAEAPARETLAKWTRGASRRDVHLEILVRHRLVKQEIRDLVARLKPRARPLGRVFQLVYQPDLHRLTLTHTDRQG